MITKSTLNDALQRCCLVLLLICVLGSTNAMAQGNFTVSGKIIDENDLLGIPGVNVIEKGTSNGTITDIDGGFSLSVSNESAVLEVSFLGYKTQEINVAGQSSIDIQLGQDSEVLDEIVVIGYGTIKKSDLTGSVSSIGSDDLTKKNTTNALEAIQGNVPGVQVSNNTGRIGDGFNIQIRGNNSLISDTKPLFVVDGTPVDDISFLNPQDIARMDVLKDASSAAIYGSRGASGVVIITTKSGSTAKPGMKVSLESSYGTKKVARLPEMMGGEKWWLYHQSAYFATTNGGDAINTDAETLAGKVVGSSNTVLLDRATKNQTFDWYDAVLQDGSQSNNYLDISGRAENGLGYNIGFGYQTETGNISRESLDKFTLKAGLNHKLSEKFTTGVNITVAKTDEELGSSLAMREAFRLNPFLSPWAVDANGAEIVGEYFNQPGKLTGPDGGGFLINKTSTYNPLVEIQNSSDQIQKWRTLGNIFLGYQALDWLSFKTSYSGNVSNNRRGKAWGAETNTGISNNNLPSGELTQSDNFNYTWDNQFNVNYNYKKDHSFSLLGLQSLFSTTTESTFLRSQRQPFDTGFYNLGSGDAGTYNLSSNFVKKTLNSYAVRLNYAFRDKYLVTASNRWDGSSVLADGNKWSSFPSVAVAWRISEESFLQNNNTISSLKARVSLGYTGNDNVSAYSTLNGLNQQTYYDFNGVNANGWLAGSLANSDLSWEKTREFNFGLDFGFLNDRIVGSIDVYDRLSDDLIFAQTLPLESGWESTFANVGSVSNKGVEVLLTTRNIRTKNLKWNTTFTFTKNTNNLESLYGQSEVDDIGNNLFIGESLNSYYNYVFDGIWQESEADLAASFGQTPGQARVKDLNGDGIIDANNDRQILGNSDASWIGSLLTSVEYKNFDLSASIFTNQGVFAYSEFHQNFTDVRDRGRQKLDIDDWFIPTNGAGIPAQASNFYPQPRNAGTYWRNDKVGYYRDASFVKVKNIAIGYTLDQSLTNKLNIGSCRIYANVLNPFVFTEYEGYDPEWAVAGYNIARVSFITYQGGLSLQF